MSSMMIRAFLVLVGFVCFTWVGDVRFIELPPDSPAWARIAATGVKLAAAILITHLALRRYLDITRQK